MFRSQLIARERLWTLKTAAMLSFGAPLSLIGPLVLATIFYVASVFLLGFEWYVRWTWYFGVLTAVCVPLLYRLELRTRGDYLGDVMRDTTIQGDEHRWLMPGVAGHFAALAHVSANPRVSSAGLVEVFLFGPRLVVGAVRQRRTIRRLRNVDRDRAATVLEAIIAAGGSADIVDLRAPGESDADMVPALGYLAVYQWIEVHSSGERVWLLEGPRRALEA